jgi:hypothetical protein
MNTVANLELGLAEQLSILLGGEQPGQGQQIVIGSALEDLEDALGFGFLIDRALRLAGHGWPPKGE